MDAIGMEDLEVRVDFEEIPFRHVCDGEDISPSIEIAGLRAPYLAVIVEDADSASGAFTHWLIWNIRATEVIPEGIPPAGEVTDPIRAVQGMNDFRSVGYGGPCPPKGKTHRYFFRVYGMSEAIDLPPGATRRELETALEAVAVQYGEAMAVYTRRPMAVTGQ